jgi:hypothetical protein
MDGSVDSSSSRSQFPGIFEMREEAMKPCQPQEVLAALGL